MSCLFKPNVPKLFFGIYVSVTVSTGFVFMKRDGSNVAILRPPPRFGLPPRLILLPRRGFELEDVLFRPRTDPLRLLCRFFVLYILFVLTKRLIRFGAVQVFVQT